MPQVTLQLTVKWRSDEELRAALENWQDDEIEGNLREALLGYMRAQVTSNLEYDAIPAEIVG